MVAILPFGAKIDSAILPFGAKIDSAYYVQLEFGPCAAVSKALTGSFLQFVDVWSLV